MAGRKKISFSQEHNDAIRMMIAEGLSLRAMVGIIESKFDMKIDRKTLNNHIKSLGIERVNNKAGRKSKEADWDFDATTDYEGNPIDPEITDIEYTIGNQEDFNRYYDFTNCPTMPMKDGSYSTWYDRNGMLKIIKSGLVFTSGSIKTVTAGKLRSEFELQHDYEFHSFANCPDDFDLNDVKRWCNANSNDRGIEVGEKIYKLRLDLADLYDDLVDEIHTLYDDIQIKWQMGLGAADEIRRFNELCHTLYVEKLKYGYESSKLLGVSPVLDMILLEDQASQQYILGRDFNKLTSDQCSYDSDFMKYMQKVCGEDWDKQLDFTDAYKKL